MKSKILFISLAVVLALSVGLVGCGDGNGDVIPAEPAKLIVSIARDTNEALAVFDLMAAGPVYREFVEYVNDDLGGVALKQYGASVKKQIQLDVREITVDPWNIGDITTAICDDIDKGDSHFLWGGPGTDCIYTQAPIANREHVVLFTLEGGATGISNDPNKLALWPYVFINLSYSDWYELPVVAATLEAALGEDPGDVTAYVVHIEGEHGDEYLATAEDNFTVVGEAEVPYDPADFTNPDEVINSAIVAYNSTPFDLFCGFAYVDHVNYLTSSIQTWSHTTLGKLNPEAIVFGPGANFGGYAFTFPNPGAPNPALVEGIMGFAVAAYNKTDIVNITPVYDRIADRLDDEDPTGLGVPGVALLDYWGIPCYWAGLEMWLAAVEDVGYVNQDLLRDALAAFEGTGAGDTAAHADTIMGKAWYKMYGTGGSGGGNMDYLCHTGEIGQWQSATMEIVGPVDAGEAVPGLPNYVVTGNFTLMRDAWTWTLP